MDTSVTTSARQDLTAGTYEIDASENIGVNPSLEPSIGELIERRLSRRGLLKGLAVTTALGAAGSVLPGAGDAEAARLHSFTFKEIAKTLDEKAHVPDGYEIQTLIRWGDKVAKDAPAFDPAKQSAAAQAKQFGYNNDFVGFLPLPLGTTKSDHGLLVVNHEYTIAGLMHAGLGSGDDANYKVSKAQAEIELEAHGMTVIEIKRTNGKWAVVDGSKYNRRITGTTETVVSGPAAGHDLLKTKADPTGTRVLGTLNNCAGGVTPWGTVLSGEENFNGYFGGDIAKTPYADEYKRYGLTAKGWYAWPTHFDRFNVEKEPNEPHRFGWIVEIDPYNPSAPAVKRTALGRFKHEGANVILNKDGRAVVYMGDDERFDYVYKFVSKNKFDPANRDANLKLLDEGTLYVAQFADDGNVKWIALVHGENGLTAENGFNSQADVLVNCRKAGDVVKATPMDRPEDVEPNLVNGKVYVLLTNNSRRKADQVNKANPRANNTQGHVVEITPPGKDMKDYDHAATEAKWSIFLMAGKPGQDAGAFYHRATTENGWLSCPDNVAFDSKGRAWLATDGATSAAGIADGLYATEVSGPGKALTRLFFQAPTGAEVCGPWFTPDDSTLFIAVQHPGEDDGSSFDAPSTRWPDFRAGMPPRPSVIAITKKGGGAVG